MSERIVHDCDKCGAEGIAARRYVLTVDRKSDGPIEEVHAIFELCHNCVGLLLKASLGKMDFAEAESWVKENIHNSVPQWRSIQAPTPIRTPLNDDS